jgi:hypothetical protein
LNTNLKKTQSTERKKNDKTMWLKSMIKDEQIEKYKNLKPEMMKTLPVDNLAMISENLSDIMDMK